MNTKTERLVSKDVAVMNIMMGEREEDFWSGRVEEKHHHLDPNYCLQSIN
jgi:hypothetical protein